MTMPFKFRFASKYQRRAGYLSLTFGILGLMAAHHFQRNDLFERAGAGITVVAIYFASRRLAEKLEENRPLIDNLIEGKRPAFQKRYVEANFDPKTAGEAEEQFITKVRGELTQWAKRETHRILRLEVYLFIIGTTIWGFGSLVLDCFWKWPHAVC